MDPTINSASVPADQADPSGSGHVGQAVSRCVTRALSRARAKLPVSQHIFQVVRQRATQALGRAPAAGVPGAQADPSASGKAGAVAGRCVPQATSTSSGCCLFPRKSSPVGNLDVRVAPVGANHAVQSARDIHLQANKGLATAAVREIESSDIAHGKRNIMSNRCMAESANGIHRSPSKKIRSGHSKILCNVPKIDASTVKFAKGNDNKSVALSSEQQEQQQQQQPCMTDHIKDPDKKAAVSMKWVARSAKDHDNKPTSLASEHQLQPCIRSKRSAVSMKHTAESFSGLHKLPSMKSHSEHTENLCGVPKLNVPAVASPKHHHNESTPSSSEQQPKHRCITVHIKGPDIFNDSPLELIGERCQLCGIDLAFWPAGSAASYSSNPPVHAVLPCAHTFHNSCLEDIFGPQKPSQAPRCFRCPDSEAQS